MNTKRWTTTPVSQSKKAASPRCVAQSTAALASAAAETSSVMISGRRQGPSYRTGRVCIASWFYHWHIRPTLADRRFLPACQQPPSVSLTFIRKSCHLDHRPGNARVLHKSQHFASFPVTVLTFWRWRFHSRHVIFSNHIEFVCQHNRNQQRQFNMIWLAANKPGMLVALICPKTSKTTRIWASTNEKMTPF